jgi:2-keto-4-pentenoate hydratase/2-oxohepta-3-ene-1,7-dioic acid hydratase in catechol pathway
MSDAQHSRRFARVRLADGRACFVELAPERTLLLSDAPWLGGTATGELDSPLDAQARGPAARRLAPVTPAKILCIGRNYRAHASELGNEVPAEPLLFLKPSSAIIGPDEAIELPPRELSQRVDHEAEIAVVIGRRLRRATRDQAHAAIFGVTLACDVTARDLQKKDGQWTRAKGMDTFCPVGPVVVSGLDPQSLEIHCRVSGELRQQGSATQMIFAIADVLAYASQAMTLEPGDLVLTGTPSGVGPLADGDRVDIESEPIGVLSLTVRGPS